MKIIILLLLLLSAVATRANVVSLPSSLLFTTVNSRDITGTHTFTEGAGDISLTAFMYQSPPRDVYRFAFATSSMARFAILEVSVLTGQRLTVGTYSGTSNPSGDYANLLVNLGGGTVGFASSESSYTITSVEYSSLGVLSSVELTFRQTQRFGGFPPAEMSGRLKFNPIPEPSILAILLLGYLGLTTRRRR